MITRLLAMALIVATGAAGWQFMRANRLDQENAALTRRLTVAQAQVEAAALSQAVAEREAVERAHRERVARQALETLSGDFANADLPIDPRITALLECLRSGSGACADLPRDTAEPSDP